MSDPQLFQSAGWRVFGESVVGVAHERVGDECEDHHRIGCTADGKLVVAVADGAGSAECGGLGAATAVEGALAAAAASSMSCRETVRASMVAARAAVERAATGSRLDRFATTLILLVADSAGFAIGQVGDGFAVAVDPSGLALGFSTPQRGEFANDTAFLTGAAPHEIERVDEWSGPVAGVAVLSDGLQRLALQLPAATPHGPFFDRIFRLRELADDAIAAQLSGFLRSSRVRERTVDDLTLVVGWRE